MDKKELGRYIREQRKALGLSQWALANATGINRSVISYIESGYVRPSDKQMRALEAVLTKQTETVTQ